MPFGLCLLVRYSRLVLLSIVNMAVAAAPRERMVTTPATVTRSASRTRTLHIQPGVSRAQRPANWG